MSLCPDESMQSIASHTDKVEGFLSDALIFIQTLQGLPVPSWMSEDTQASLANLSGEVENFQGFDGGKNETFSMESVRFLQVS